jgi:hypothetical protein
MLRNNEPVFVMAVLSGFTGDLKRFLVTEDAYVAVTGVLTGELLGVGS